MSALPGAHNMDSWRYTVCNVGQCTPGLHPGSPWMTQYTENIFIVPPIMKQPHYTSKISSMIVIRATIKSKFGT